MILTILSYVGVFMVGATFGILCMGVVAANNIHRKD